MLRSLPAIAASLLLATPALSATPSFTITLDGPGEWRTIAYVCEGREERLPVAYVNVAPNFLAIIAIDGETLIFASSVSGSGVRYLADRYEWRTKGADAQLYDLTTDPEAPPLLTCLEANDTP